MYILHNSVDITYLQTGASYIIFTLKSICKNTYSLMARVLRSILQECGDFTWRLSDCEELVGGFTVGDGVDIERNIFI